MKHCKFLLFLALVSAAAPMGAHPDSCRLTGVFTSNGPQGAPIPPMVTFIAPSEILAGGPAFSLTVNGDNFIPTSIVQWNGVNRATAFLNPTQLTAMISAQDIVSGGTAAVTVFNPFPPGGISNTVTFTINNPLPLIFGLSPGSGKAGGASFSLTVSGANFVQSSIVQWNGLGRPTRFINSTQLTATISASDIHDVGSANVSVVNPGPGGGPSATSPFAVKEPDNPVPRILFLSPDSTTSGTGWLTLTVDGSGFVSSSIVQWNGNNRNTMFGSATRLTATIYPTDTASATTALITVFNPAPGGGTSNSQVFIIRPGSILPSAKGEATPSSIRAGGTVLLVVRVTPGANPPSTGLSVTADLLSIGGSPTQQLFDDGTHGDQTRGDNIFSFRTTASAKTANGKKALPVAVVDAQGRKATASIQLTVGPSQEMVPGHAVPISSGVICCSR